LPDEKIHVCPFLDTQKYNGDLNGGNGFTVKEILIDVQRRLGKYQENMNRRVTLLEHWRTGIVSIGSFCLAILAALRALWR
jgi:hypothetical protein